MIFYLLIILILICLWEGVSANADPRTYKLRTRVINICDYRRRQPNRSAMEGPRPGETAWLITVFSVPGKYALVQMWSRFKWVPLQSLRVSGGNKNDNMKSEHHTIAENTQTRVRPDTTSILQLHMSAGFGDFGGSNNKGHAACFKKCSKYNVNKESQSKNVFPTIFCCSKRNAILAGAVDFAVYYFCILYRNTGTK